MRTYKIYIVAAFINYMNAKAQSYEIDPLKYDTINKIDTKGKKQGKWVIYNYHSSKSNQVETKVHQKGTFVNSEKSGIWEEMYMNGNTKSKITYESDEPKGRVQLFNDQGGIIETGNWVDGHWQGLYRSYYKNGNLKFEFFFDKNGQRCGYQKYFYDNGMLMKVGIFEQGLEDGYITEYDNKGNMKSQSFYIKGNLAKPGDKPSNQKNATL